jgi:hypothetical protein
MASIVGFVIRGGRTRSKSFEEFGRAVLDASSYTYFELRRHERGEPAALIIDGRVSLDARLADFVEDVLAEEVPGV